MTASDWSLEVHHSQADGHFFLAVSHNRVWVHEMLNKRKLTMSH